MLSIQKTGHTESAPAAGCRAPAPLLRRPQRAEGRSPRGIRAVPRRSSDSVREYLRGWEGFGGALGA